MRILLVGCGKSDFNYRKIEGFYNALSKIGKTEWVQKIFQSEENDYDIVFGEINLSDIYSNIERFKSMKIKALITWRTYTYEKLIELANLKPDTFFLNAYKSNILNNDIKNNFVERYKTLEGILYKADYQMWQDEGVDLVKFTEKELPSNLELCYLPCCLSEKEDFVEDKKYDICYFGTIHNRPGVDRCLKVLSEKYSILSNAWDRNGIKNPDECYQLYKNCKVSLSEQVHPVILEYPVRLGESTSTGCRLFLLESIKCQDVSNSLIPDYTSCDSVDDMINKIDEYLQSFDINQSKDLYNNFVSTYDNAVKFLLKKIENKL